MPGEAKTVKLPLGGEPEHQELIDCFENYLNFASDTFAIESLRQYQFDFSRVNAELLQDVLTQAKSDDNILLLKLLCTNLSNSQKIPDSVLQSLKESMQYLKIVDNSKSKNFTVSNAEIELAKLFFEIKFNKQTGLPAKLDKKDLQAAGKYRDFYEKFCQEKNLEPDKLLQDGVVDHSFYCIQQDDNQFDIIATKGKHHYINEKNVSTDEDKNEARADKELIPHGGFGKFRLGVSLNTGQLVGVKLEAYDTEEDLHEKQKEALKTKKGMQSNVSTTARARRVEKQDKPFLKADNAKNKFITIMEYIDGDSLNDWIFNNRNKKDDKTNAIRHKIAKGMIDELKRIHQAGLLHRDIKPENMMVQVNNDTVVVRYIDFGLSKEPVSTDQKIRGRAGTTFFMSPETLQGYSTYQSDEWSVAISLAQLMGVGQSTLKHVLQINQQNLKVEDKQKYANYLNKFLENQNTIWNAALCGLLQTDDKRKHIDYIQNALELLNNPKDINLYNQYYEAFSKGDFKQIDAFIRLCKQYPVLMNVAEDDLQTPLMLAIKNNNTQAIEMLEKNGAILDIYDLKSAHPSQLVDLGLQYLIHKKDLNALSTFFLSTDVAVKLNISQMGLQNVRNNNINEYHSAQVGSADSVLKQHSYHENDVIWNNILTKLSQDDDSAEQLQMLEESLALLAPPNDAFLDKNTTLKSIHDLIHSISDYLAYKTLHNEFSHGNFENKDRFIELCQKYPHLLAIDHNQKNRETNQANTGLPLYLAAKHQQIELFNQLIDIGASIVQAGKVEPSILEIAAQNDDLDIIEILAQKKMLHVDSYFVSYLEDIIEADDTMHLLLLKKYDVYNQLDKDKNNIILLAIQEDIYEVVEYLLKNELADLLYANQLKETPVNCALNNVNIIKTSGDSSTSNSDDANADYEGDDILELLVDYAIEHDNADVINEVLLELALHDNKTIQDDYFEKISKENNNNDKVNMQFWRDLYQFIKKEGEGAEVNGVEKGMLKLMIDNNQSSVLNMFIRNLKKMQSADLLENIKINEQAPLDYAIQKCKEQTPLDTRLIAELVKAIDGRTFTHEQIKTFIQSSNKTPEDYITTITGYIDDLSDESEKVTLNNGYKNYAYEVGNLISLYSQEPLPLDEINEQLEKVDGARKALKDMIPLIDITQLQQYEKSSTDNAAMQKEKPRKVLDVQHQTSSKFPAKSNKHDSPDHQPGGVRKPIGGRRQ